MLGIVGVHLRHHLDLVRCDVGHIEYGEEDGGRVSRVLLAPLGQSSHDGVNVSRVVGVAELHLLHMLRGHDHGVGVQEPPDRRAVEEGEGLDVFFQALLCSLL